MTISFSMYKEALWGFRVAIAIRSLLEEQQRGTDERPFLDGAAESIEDEIENILSATWGQVYLQNCQNDDGFSAGVRRVASVLESSHDARIESWVQKLKSVELNFTDLLFQLALTKRTEIARKTSLNIDDWRAALRNAADLPIDAYHLEVNQLIWVLKEVDAVPLELAVDEKLVRSTSTERKNSLDYRSVIWYGAEYSFTAQQAAVVQALWESDAPEVGDMTLLEIAGAAESSRLSDLFRKHPAWGSMIIEGGTRGSRRLQPPLGTPPQDSDGS